MPPSQGQRIQAQMRLLVRELLAIADQAGFTEEKLIRLEKVLNNIGGTGQFTPKMAKVATAINEIAGALAAAGSPNRVAGINNVRRALFQLAKDYEKAGLSSAAMQRIARMPAGGAQTRAGMEYRNEQAIQAYYTQKAAMSFTPQEMIGQSSSAVRDQIGARATALRLVTETQRKVLEQGIVEKRLTMEVERRAAAERETNVLLKQAIGLRREEFRQAFTSRGGLQQRMQEGRPIGVTSTGRIAGVSDEQSIGRILQQYRGFIGSDVGVENLRKRMEALGITTARVMSPTEDLATGVRTFSFAVDKGSGATARATIRLDRFGTVMRDVGTRFRSFSSGISNNLVKVVQWGLATGVVYGILRGFRQVMTEIIEVESELASVQIVLGKGVGDLNTIFEEAAVVADLTSTSIEGVLEGYTLAYQAAGAFEDPTLRAAAANNLLQESMLLATLSGIDQATAMDTLVGALRQTGMELTQGRELLDRWVAVSRESNVSLNTLAQTYAIVGAAATGLGLTFEELNALTATLAEATGLSATETGNAIRGIIAGFQSTQAEKILGRFGVETRKASGELRDFWGLLNEVSELLASGAISPSELTEIANAIGGGYRRGAQVQTILEGMARAQQLVNVQMNSAGEAAAALETKTATLKDAIIRLGNAFTSLAQSLGDEGGFLFVGKAVVEVMTFFVDIIDRLVGGLGKATPAMLAFGATWLFLQSGLGKGLLAKPAGGLLTGVAGRFAPRGSALIQQRVGAQYMLPGMAMTRGGALGAVRGGIKQRLGGTALSDPLAILAVLGPSLLTISEAIGKPAAERKEVYNKAGIQIAGGIVGILAGGPLGGIIGTTIAGAFADAIIDRERDIGGRLAEIFIESAKEAGAEPAPDTETPPGKALTAMALELPQAVQNLADYVSALLKVREYITPARGSRAFQAPETVIESRDLLLAAIYKKVGEELPTDLAERLEGVAAYTGVIDLKIVPKIDDADIEGALELINKLFVETIADMNIIGPFREAVEAGVPGMEAAAGSLVEKFVKEAQRQFILGDIGVTDLIGISETSIEALAPTLETLKLALDLTGLDIGVNELVESYLDLDDVSRSLLDGAARAVGAQSDTLDFYKDSGKSVDLITFKTKEYNTALRNLADLQRVLSTRQILAGVEERPIVDFGRLTSQQIQQVRIEADRVRDQQALAFADGGEEGMRLWVERLGNVLITTGSDLGKLFIGEFVDQDPAFIKAAIKNLGFEEAIGDVAQFGLRDLRDKLGKADLPALMRRYEQIKGVLTTTFPEFEPKEENLGLIMKDGLQRVHVDMTIFNLAMQDLIDVNERQLEGVWNLPSGMTAFVAWTSLFSRNVSSGGGVQGMEPFGGDAGMVETTGGRAPGRVFTDVDVTPELQALRDRVNRLDTLVELGPKEVGIGIQDYVALKNEAEAARGEYQAAFYQAVREVNLGGGVIAGAVGGITAPQLDADTIAQSFQEVFQLENKIELNASIRLIVDGRTLANVVKQYLFTDLVQATDRSLGGGGGYVIEAE